MAAKILTLDIETAPILAHVWGIYDENIGLNQVKKDWHLLSYAAKWLENGKIFYMDQRNAKSIEDDYRLCQTLWKLMDEADIIITQNGDSFDLPKIRSRMVIHRMTPPSPFRTIDTKKLASRLFSFTSNRLEYLSENLTPNAKKSSHKKYPGFELWRACLAGDKKAWEELRKYNIRDVIATEKVYLALRPWSEGHPNLGMYVDVLNPACPKCGGTVVKYGKKTVQLNIYHQYQCKKCGGYSRGRTPINAVEHRRRQLVN